MIKETSVLVELHLYDYQYKDKVHQHLFKKISFNHFFKQNNIGKV